MENLQLALNLTFVGITVVFMSLVLLSLIIYLFTKILTFKNKDVSVKNDLSDAANVLEIEEDDASELKTDLTASVSSDDELIAVIMAAIQASMVPVSQCKLQVKSFRRIEQRTPAWNKAGRLEQISNTL